MAVKLELNVEEASSKLRMGEFQTNQMQIEILTQNIHEMESNLFYLERHGVRKDNIVYLQFKAELDEEKEKLEKAMGKRGELIGALRQAQGPELKVES